MQLPKQIISNALELKPAQKFIIIEALLNSLDKPDPEISKIWVKEAEKRLKAYNEGKLKTISFEDMFA
ncbi:addiction module protein [Candidatus Margulisiibacteriota bacterium]